MFTLFCVPRVNALGHTGPEISSEKILEGKAYTKVEVSNDDIAHDERIIYEFAKEEIQKNCFFVGGDHSITYPIGKAFLEKFGKKDSCMIIFDAHADLMDATENPTHEEVFKGLLDLGWDPKQIIFVGLRKIEPEEQHIIEEKGIIYFDSREDIEKRVNMIEGKKIYVSIDIDALDPSIAPGVSYREENGLCKEDFFALLERIKKLDVQTYDLVEVVPERDIEDKTLKLAKEIVDFVTQ